MLSKNEIVRHIEKVGDIVTEEYTLVAVGGTCLTLLDIKQYTRDVDYVVERGDMLRFADAYESIHDEMIHLAEPCTCFAIYMPNDYMSTAYNVGTFGRINLYALSLEDVIITKASRYNDRDKADLESCADHVENIDCVVNRLRDFNLGHHMDNARVAFSEIFGREV